jgi:hypothetical protein
MSSLSTLPKGDSAWLLRKAIERIIQQISVLETNIGSSTTGNSANTQIIFNDAGTLRGDAGLTYNKTTDLLSVGAATITGDLTVATDRLKVVTGSTAVQIGATTQTQIGTTAWPSTDIGKSNARFLVGNEGIVINWNESSPVIGNYSSIFAGAKTGIGATTIGGLQIRAGIENASNRDGFCSFWTSNQAAGGYVKRYEIDSNGVSTWSVGGSTAMTLNSTGLAVGTTAQYARFTATGSNSTGIANIQNSPFASNANTNLSCYIGHDGTANRPFIQAATGNAGSAFDLLIQPYGGNVGVGTALSGGSISNTAKILAGIFSTLIGNTGSIATATPTTMFAAPSESTLMVTAYITGSAAPANYNAVSIVKVSSGTAAITAISTALNLTITLSGANVQVTQTSGVNQTIQFNVLRLA